MIWFIIILLIKFTQPVFSQSESPSPTITTTPANTPTTEPTPTPTTVPPTPTPTISLTLKDVPSNSNRNNQFNVNLELKNGKPGTTYHFKVYGQVGGEYVIDVSPNSNWLNGYNGAWDSMPTVQTNSIGYCQVSMSLRSSALGSISLTGKSVEASNHDKSLLSNIQSIQINEPTSTSTPVPTSPPIPSSTPTIRPTSSPTPYPTASPAPLETPINEPLPTNDPILPSPTPDSILGIQDIIKPTLSPNKTSGFHFPSQILPGIFIFLGGGLLLIPLVFSKLKK